MQISHQKIKPLLNRTLCLQNISKYNQFLIKRPKTTLNFKFLRKFDQFAFSHEYDRKIQVRLHKALKLLKSVRKVDLSEFKVRDSSISQAKLLSILKRLSKVETISMKRMMDLHQLSDNLLESWLRYFPRIRHLNWGLGILCLQRDVENFVGRQTFLRNPLRYLHYCPKIKSLKIDSAQISSAFLKKALQIKKYPSCLKHLDVQARLDGRQLNLSAKNFQRLESLGFAFDSTAQSLDSTIYTINSLSKMTALREINLHFIDSMTPGIETIFTKICQERKLNKVKFAFDFEMPNFSQIFQALKACPLTYFSLETYYTNNKTVLESISDFVKDTISLEFLHITLRNSAPFKEADPLKSLCHQVSKLQKLQHLQLVFKSSNGYIKDYVLELDDVSPKNLKLKTFSLDCTQINSPRPFPYLISQLENSYNSLQKLTLGLENHFLTEQSNDEILNFIKRFENIQELKLPRLDILSIKFLNEILHAVQALKFLKSFQLGKIPDELTSAEFAEVLEVILSKTGLREFWCLLAQSFLAEMQEGSAVNIKKIMRINPSLELVSLNPFRFSILALKQIDNWV